MPNELNIFINRRTFTSFLEIFMKKLMTILFSLCICFCFLSACDKTEPQFKVGEIIVSSMGESYTQYITVGQSNDLSGDIVEITSHKIKAIKKLDPTNLEDYEPQHGYYYQYLYLATVVGKVDSKYAGKTIFFDSKYLTDVQIVAIDGKGGALIKDDGSFEKNYYVYCNEVLVTFYSGRMRVW